MTATNAPSQAHDDLVARIDAALPQTQCTRCGYPDCKAYAQAIAAGEARINQCPPGGTEGIARLSAVTGHAPRPLSAQHGAEGPRTVVFIDEAWCIGCTLCIKACPTDAIVGSNKMMHTVIEPYCTGCELCIPVCPVDCIHLENVSGLATGWSAWSAPLAQQARERYAQHCKRMPAQEGRDTATEDASGGASSAIHGAGDTIPVPDSSATADPRITQETLDPRKAVIAAALERARQRRQQERH